MRLSRSVSVSLSSKRKHGSKVRKKHKLLNAICEDVYNQNHGFSAQSSGKNSGAQQESNALELRRSSRVRRSPVVLDASPPPVKKRKKLGKNDEKLLQRNTKEKDRDRGSLPNDNNSEGSDEKGGWRSRLRSRIRNLGVSPRGKRKLFEDLNVVKKAKVKGAKEDGIEFGELTAPRSKRPRRTTASLMVGHDDEREMEPPVVAEEACERTDAEVALKMEAKNAPRMRNGLNSENDNVSVVNNNESIDREKSGGPNDMPLDEFVDANVDAQVQFDEGLKQFECRREEDQGVAPEVGCKQLEDRPCHGRTNATLAIPSEEHVLDEGVMKVSEITRTSSTTLVKSRIKEGRLCGLCGGGTDGKPPRRLVQDAGESENEVCSGYSASEESSYDIWDGFGDEPGWLGRLLGPINDRYGIAGIWVHQLCAVWSPEVYFAGLGCLKNVRAALCRGRALRCTRCRRPGATIGCRVDRCPKTYHLACARANGCIFDHRKFLIACTDHRHIFLPHGNQYLMRINKMKAKKMKLEMRKLSNDACRKDLEAEEKWLENCGEDEEFLKRESKRLHRDMLRIAPVYIGGSDAENGGLLRGWESVAGLQDVIRCMKEVVILPLLYPEFFSNLGLTPPRGVLLHGYPGTGKTLVVRALIGACSSGDKRIAYFARKGADCLGKYVGDAERQLRLLFQVAERCQPSIIFFDEIDGLAPQRTRHQDQTHSSVVSTLLALLDGLKSRGSVVVIGATNRPEAVDPALRRPGRFDREIHFPLPSVKDRASILSLHTQKWPKPIAGSVLNWIAKRTCGFAGADLQALCTQAAMIALKRNFPLHELLSAVEKEVLDGNHVPLPSFAVEERDWLEALSCAPPPCSRRESGMAGNDVTSSPLPAHLIPCLLPPLSKLLVSLYLDERLCLPSPISRAAKVIKGIIVLNLKKKKMLFDCWWLHVDNLIQEENIAKEIEKKLTCAGILVGESSFSGSDAPTDGNDESEDLDSPKMPHDNGYSTRVLHSKSFLYGRKTGFRILIAGDPKLGQRHLASCLLYFFSGNAEIQKVDLATILQEGRGDTVQGLTQILMKCAHAQSCVLFMPRIDLWAVGKNSQDDKEDFDSISSSDRLSEQGFNLASWQAAAGDIVSHVKKNEPSEKVDNSDSCRSASHTWSLFLEQVDTLCVSASLMILATSEAPYPELPGRVRQFFKQDSLINGHPGPTEHNVPQFLLQVEESFNPDMVISSSAAELSRDVVKLFVQLLHHRTHGDSKPCKYFKSRHDGEGRIKVASKHERRTESPVQVPNSKSIKGKSNLLLAIYTFGYQLLRYPHFAELCWVTSKLKDGPCADINGPWKDKGWPFNSCIIRPGNGSSEKVPLGGSFGNGKGKEKFGLVRGLIAVGLSAYRGVYTSLREVSFEVRKVLELLVAQINTKILAGKDRCQFVRLLSQVACLEDMVNSWAHTLQSLEPDSHAPRAGSDADKLVQSEECKLSEVTPEDRNQKLAEENFREVPTTRNVDPAPSEAEIATPAEGPLQPMALSCSYHCCSDCLRVLHDSMLKLLTHRWKRSTNKKTIEDVHDDISSFSASLLSSLRRAHVAGKAFGPEASFAKLQNCACHAMEEFSTEEGEGQTNTQSGVGMRIIYKDGVVVPLDPENDVPFHCRYETLCLCSLIDWIITKNNL